MTRDTDTDNPRQFPFSIRSEGGTAWGHLMVQEIGRMLEAGTDFVVRYTSVAATDIFEAVIGTAEDVQVVDGDTLSLKARDHQLRTALGTSAADVPAIIQCTIDHGYTLKLWGRVRDRDEHSAHAGLRDYTMIVFNLTFWELSRSADDDLTVQCHNDARDRRIKALEAQVALSTLSQ